MTFRRSLTAAAAACGLMFASAAGAASTDVRAAAPAGDSRIGADITGSTFINIAILAALTVTLLLVVDGDGGGTDSPNSP